MNNKRENINEIRNTEHGVEWYRERIVEMVGQIKEQRFLKAIYISILEYLKEKEPD